jgi:ABC-type phosphate transport system ATPase subunit
MQQAARSSDYTAFFLMGEMVECQPTSTMFTRPSIKRRRINITGGLDDLVDARVHFYKKTGVYTK